MITNFIKQLDSSYQLIYLKLFLMKTSSSRTKHERTFPVVYTGTRDEDCTEKNEWSLSRFTGETKQ